MHLWYDLSILTAEERSLAKKYHLKKYFIDNKHYMRFVIDVIRASNRVSKETTRSHWVRDRFIELTQIFLECSDELFEYVNDIYAHQAELKSLSKEYWKHVCNVSSKILVHAGWNYENLSPTEKWRTRTRFEK